MEAYTQQIGRAGRDGLPARCLLLYNDAEFASYKSDFYTKNRSVEVQDAVGESTAFLQVFIDWFYTALSSLSPHLSLANSTASPHLGHSALP